MKLPCASIARTVCTVQPLHGPSIARAVCTDCLHRPFTAWTTCARGWHCSLNRTGAPASCSLQGSSFPEAPNERKAGQSSVERSPRPIHTLLFVLPAAVLENLFASGTVCKSQFSGARHAAPRPGLLNHSCLAEPRCRRDIEIIPLFICEQFSKSGPHSHEGEVVASDLWSLKRDQILRAGLAWPCSDGP